ncbi:hypothetical protein GCM10011316_01050 [Roseibium aquae]|uniref:DUF4164 family protein n=1 Tax=Roseibium aquae TaxID=1323746 RepID=A0A916T820_9HYPH|nr:DUF4164 domain-containing protein [Roseibium aquae]GGB32730.1 hypothetical protein GCM10011316_01050 [Roseibium aquae]
MAQTDTTPVLSLEAAFERLERAVGGLESAVQRRVDADRSLNSLEDDIQRLGQDRAELAETLDRAQARAERLEEANRDVSRRLVTAMESIRFVLEERGS